MDGASGGHLGIRLGAVALGAAILACGPSGLIFAFVSLFAGDDPNASSLAVLAFMALCWSVPALLAGAAFFAVSALIHGRARHLATGAALALPAIAVILLVLKPFHHAG